MGLAFSYKCLGVLITKYMYLSFRGCVSYMEIVYLIVSHRMWE